MSRRLLFRAVAAFLLWALAGFSTGFAQSGATPDTGSSAACTTLECPRCAKLCHAFCNEEAATCQKAGRRGCPGRYRACQRGCTHEICAQCGPTQHVQAGAKVGPGTVQLCRTPG